MQNKIKKMLLGPTNKDELKDHRKKVFGFGVAAFLFAAFLVLVTWSAGSRVKETANWPKVAGKIITAEEGKAVSRAGRKTVSERIAKIEYSYTVGGQQYTCDRRRVVPMFHFSEEAENVLNRYRKGMEVSVYHNPNNPSDALLQNVPTDDAKGLIQGIMYGSLFGGFTGLVIILSTLSAFFPEKQTTQIAKKVQTASGSKVPRHWPMPVRILTIIVGAPIALLGILLVINSLTAFGSTEHGILVESVTVLVMTGIMFAGGYLSWLGFSKNGKGQLPSV